MSITITAGVLQGTTTVDNNGTVDTLTTEVSSHSIFTTPTVSNGFSKGLLQLLFEPPTTVSGASFSAALFGQPNGATSATSLVAITLGAHTPSYVYALTFPGILLPSNVSFNLICKWDSSSGSHAAGTLDMDVTYEYTYNAFSLN